MSSGSREYGLAPSSPTSEDDEPSIWYEVRRVRWDGRRNVFGFAMMKFGGNHAFFDAFCPEKFRNLQRKDDKDVFVSDEAL